MISKKVLADHIRIKRPDLDPDEVLSKPLNILRWEVDYHRTKINERSSMKTTAKDLVTAVNGPGGLNKLANLNMPVKYAYKFGRLLDSARSAGKATNKERERLFTEFGVDVLDAENKPTGEKQIPPANMDVFTEKMNAYLENTVLEIWYEPVKLSELEEINVSLSPADMIALGPFIDTEDGSEK